MEQLSFDDLEVWKPVVGWEGFYEVSDHGQVRSLDRMVRNGPGSMRLNPGRTLRPGAHKTGHQHVDLWVDGAGRTRSVHVLVMEAFAGSRPNGLEIRHLDGNPANNRWVPGTTEDEIRAAGGNLIYGTRSENQRDAVRHGTQRNTRKTHCDSGHEFTPENTYDNNGGRGCRQCKRKTGLDWLHRNKGRVGK